jgi:hypothetical protein
MPIITENIKKKAIKCTNCAFMKLRDFDSKSALHEGAEALDLYDEAMLAINAVTVTSCNVCQNGQEFKKVYGCMPYEYFVPAKSKKD